MTTVKFQMGNITVPGIDGHFSQTQQHGAFVRIHHCIPDDDGIGYKSRELVGSVPKGVYGDTAQGIAAKGNPEFGQMVIAKIQKYIDSGRANPPTPAQIKQTRLDAGLTLQAAADLVGIGLKQWQHYESGYSKIRPRRWQLFLRLTDQPR